MEFFALVEKILRCPKFHLDNIFIGEKAVSDEVTKFIFKRASENCFVLNRTIDETRGVK